MLEAKLRSVLRGYAKLLAVLALRRVACELERSYRGLRGPPPSQEPRISPGSPIPYRAIIPEEPEKAP
jgi:hypothetical protein